MPGKNGYEVCEAIPADPELRHPLTAQAHIDAANRISDRDFQRLARGESAAAVLASYDLPLHFWGS